MASGKLPLACFLHYIKQDYHYLKVSRGLFATCRPCVLPLTSPLAHPSQHYARAHSIAAAKAPTLADMSSSMDIVQTVLRETENHVRFCGQFGITKEELLATDESVANRAYNGYVLDVSSSSDVLAGRVVTAPCLIGYGHMGVRLAAERGVEEGGWVDRGEGNATYAKWVAEYSGEWFQGAVRTGIELLEKTVRESPISRARMEELGEVFVTAARLEVEFWDEACRVGGWPTAAEQVEIDASEV